MLNSIIRSKGRNMSKDVKYFVMDVDGTLTDGKIYMGKDGECFKAFNIKDGCGIHDILIPAGIKPIIITGRRSQMVEKRCMELGITELYQNISNKKEVLDEILNRTSLTGNSFAYIGDDINDLACMKLIKEQGGIIGCPADAVKKIIDIVDYVCSKNGGDGAVREFIEWFIRA